MPWWAWTIINLLILAGHVKVYYMRKENHNPQDEEVSPEERAELDELEQEILAESAGDEDDDLRDLEASILAEKPAKKVAVPVNILYPKNTPKEAMLAVEENLRQNLAKKGITLGQGRDL